MIPRRVWVDSSLTHASVVGVFEDMWLAIREPLPRKLAGNTLWAEAYAIHLGISVALHYGEDARVLVQTDCKVAADLLNRKRPPSGYLWEVHQHYQHQLNVLVQWLPRTKNKVAHQLAKSANLWPLKRLSKVKWSLSSIKAWNSHGQPCYHSKQNHAEPVMYWESENGTAWVTYRVAS